MIDYWKNPRREAGTIVAGSDIVHRPLFIFTIVLLSACGGGSGGGESNSTVAPTSSAVDDVASTSEETAVEIDVTSNDINVTANTLRVVNPPQNGSVTISDGTLNYLPADNFFGADSLRYEISGSNGQTLAANVNINITNINDAPVAQTDGATTLINTPITIDVRTNDEDGDGDLEQSNIEILSTPVLGQAEIQNGLLVYTPSVATTGTETLTYRLRDTVGAFSNSVNLVIQILPITETTLSVTELGFPTLGYSRVFNSEFADTVDESPLQDFEIPANALSFALYLEGNGVTESPNDFIISELVSPSGVSFSPLFANVEFCDTRLCSILVPRAPEQIVEAGTWQYRVASLNRNLNFPAVLPDMRVSIRSGPTPNFMSMEVSEIIINPIVTANSVPIEDIQAMFDKATEVFALNGVIATFNPVIQNTEPQFSEVSSNFLHVTTRALVSQGDPSKINLFLLESFSGVNGGGLLGISGSIPSPMGFSSDFNAVLVNATATREGDRDFHISSTAAILVHEIGHYLGLAHTTEDRFQAHDFINDTPQCIEDSHDTNLDGIANQSECPDGSNIMFWMDEFVFEKTTFSADQQRVMHLAPIGVVE